MYVLSLLASLVLVNPRQGTTCTYTDAVLDEGDLGDGEAYITRMDGTIISGTFSGGSIKEGRFDIKYREKPEGGEARRPAPACR